MEKELKKLSKAEAKVISAFERDYSLLWPHQRKGVQWKTLYNLHKKGFIKPIAIFDFCPLELTEKGESVWKKMRRII